MEIFIDDHGQKIALSLHTRLLSDEIKHVIVIPLLSVGLLMTNHPLRGIEFPGGKVEEGETLEEAAKREVFEETGANITSLQFVGDYRVYIDDAAFFTKRIFVAKVSNFYVPPNYLETNGPVYHSWSTTFTHNRYSFLMRDGIMERAMESLAHQCMTYNDL